MLRSCFLAILVSSSASAFAWGAPKLTDIRPLVDAGKAAEAVKTAKRGLESAKTPEEKEAWGYLHAWSLLKNSEDEKALAAADGLLSGKLLLEEETRAIRAQALEKLDRKDAAIAEDDRILEMGPHFQLRFETSLRTGRLRLAEGKARQARNLFAALEKRTRGTPAYPDVILELARAERKLHATSASCRWLRKLYAKAPLHPAVKEWGPVLSSNEIDGVRTGCPNTNEEFRQRVRALMWAGEEDRARREVQDVAQAIANEDRLEADETRAWFLLQNGEPDEAFALLQDAYPKRKNKKEFLTLYASAAARSGNAGAAVGAYHRIHELSGKTATARKALYQSAYLSYQFRDYDGAGRRFKEFIKKYPRSGLRRDAEWNLAWIAYLKGDYKTALKQFKPFNGRVAGIVRERTRYWMGMTHLRLGETEKARGYFAALAADRSGSYYTTAAGQRLARLPAAVPPAKDDPKVLGALRFDPMMQPSPDELRSVAGSEAEESESEATIAAETIAADDGDKDDDDDEAGTDIVQETGKSDVLDNLPTMKAPANAKRFERAKALIRLGFPDEARWELYEIERRTRGRDELRTLVTVYEEAGQYHRSSSIAQLRFGGARIAQGMEGARALWESAYPRAFQADVKLGAKEQAVPEEFIWGIMKAESRFKRDAVSPVGALGLMQIMPGTGRKIASLRKDTDFAPSSLLTPQVAIRYGSTYLKHLSKSFDGQIPLIAAAYNAGPHRVHGWLLSFGSLDMDEFIEHIPFLETREYVRRVVANASVYSSLYGGRRDLVNLAAPITVKGRVEWSRKENWE